MVVHKRSIGVVLLLVLAVALIWVGNHYSEPIKLTWPLFSKTAKQSPAAPAAVPAMAPTAPNLVEQHKNDQSNAEYFVNYRLERERARSAQIDLLKEMVENPQTDANTRKDAQNQLLALRTLIEKELMIENLLKGKNYTDAVFFFDNGVATVVVDAKDLTESQVVQISDIVSKISGAKPSEVIVIEKK